MSIIQKKKLEPVSDSLFYHRVGDILKEASAYSYLCFRYEIIYCEQSEEMSAELSETLIKADLWRESYKISYPHIHYNRYATQALSLMGKPFIGFLTYLYASYAPSLLDLIQTFANPLTEGTVTKGRPLDGTNRLMEYFTSITTKDKQGEWTSITDLYKYTTPYYSSDNEDNWADGIADDSVEVDSIASDEDYDYDTAIVDSDYIDTAEWDTTEWDSVIEDYKYEPDTTLEETDRAVYTHTETRIGKDSWPAEISKTITLEDNGVAWIYRRR